MFQFEYLNKQKMPSKEVFFERFGEFIATRRRRATNTRSRYAIRITYSTAFFEFLKDKGSASSISTATTCRPSGRSSTSFKPETASFQVIRLHGGDRLEIEGETGEVWNKVVAPKPGGLKSAAKIVRANAKKRVLTYLNFNNHFEGSAPLSIGRFLDVLAGKKIEAKSRSELAPCPASSILAVVSPPLMR